MKILFVTAISEPQSFGGQIVDGASAALEALGHSTVISDLYAQKFPAIAHSFDFTPRHDPEFFSLQDEQKAATSAGTLHPAVKAEQDKIRDADLVIFAAPVYWSSLPAMMHGWIEQVLTPGFAYDQKNIFDQGLLKGKSAFFVMTHAGKLGAATDYGVQAKLQDILKGLDERPLRYSGFQTLSPLSVRPPYYKNEKARIKALKAAIGDVITHVEEAQKAVSQPSTQVERYPLIHLNGRPGVGKKTIGRELAKKIGAAFVDNHTLLNPAIAACGRGEDGYYRLNRKIRDAVFDELALELQKRPVILTNALTDQVEEHRDMYAEIALLARKAEAPFVPVMLSVDFNENARRIISPDRAKDTKLMDAGTLAQLYKDFTMMADDGTITVDTTNKTPAQSARDVMKHLPKPVKT